LTVVGRINTLINRGGEKVALEHVEEILDEHPAVAESASCPWPARSHPRRACRRSPGFVGPRRRGRNRVTPSPTTSTHPTVAPSLINLGEPREGLSSVPRRP
jgi:acyl-CoA synthetase (AMP-forming)/AMP-acid ligase II